MLIRVGVCIQNEDQRQKLFDWLGQKGVMAVALKDKGLKKIIAKEPLDLIILAEEALSMPIIKELENILSYNRTADLLLLSHRQDLSAEIAMHLAGRVVVLPASSCWQIIVDTLQNLIDRRLDLNRSFINRQQRLERVPSLNDFCADTARVEPFVQVARKVMYSDSSLLITGETGVGKEWLARAIHLEGARKDGPFVPVNCAALPDNLLESELFGHEQGAFTGAIKARRGAFELSHKGTIFLDEIGDMPWHLQSKLLRVLQDKEFQKIGGEKTIRVDVRIVAATNHDLQALVEQGKFRRDLYYRLGVVSIKIPPLRERPDDIPALVKRLIERLNISGKVCVKTIDSAALKALLAYNWPGNIRELMNVLERAALLGDGKCVRLEDLPVEMTRSQQIAEIMPDTFSKEDSRLFELQWKEAKDIVLEEFEKRYFENLLKQYRGMVAKAAQAAGISPRAMHDKMTRHGIRKEKYRS